MSNSAPLTLPMETESGRQLERTADLVRSDLVGDGYDPEPLLTAQEVAGILRVPVKSVYSLPMQRVRVGRCRIRWRPDKIRDFIDRRTESP